jgi:poly(A) polymerase/tRNA nucleotidyltransferase (CCA-adding enzyme)
MLTTIDVLKLLQASTVADVYIVGGFVRDLLRGKTNDDLDIVIRGLPLESLKAFLLNYGVFTEVPLSQTNDILKVSICLFRAHDDNLTAQISFPRRGKLQIAHHDNTLEQDVKVRDFTINTLYLPINYKSAADVVDLSGGVAAIQQGVIIANGDPYAIIEASPIRILRAVSLACRLGYVIHKSLRTAISERTALINKCPQDTIRLELNKILLSEKPSRGFRLLHILGLLKVVMPQLHACYGVTQNNKYHMYDVFEHCIKACDHTTANLALRLAALLHDIGKPRAKRAHEDGKITFHNHEIIGAGLAETLLSKLNYDIKLKKQVCDLIRLHMYYYTQEFTDAAVRRFIASIGITEEDIDSISVYPLFQLRMADRLGNGFKKQAITPRQLELEARIVKCFGDHNTFTVKELAINGSDIISLCEISPGPLVGKTLNYLLDRVLEDPSLNNKEDLINLSYNIIKGGRRVNCE